MISGLNALAAFIVGSFVYIVGKRRTQNAVWFLFNILLSIWSFCIYKIFDATGGSLSPYWLKGSFAALIFLVPVFLHFLSIYSDREIFRKKILSWIYALFTLFFLSFLIFPDEFIKSTQTSKYFEYLPVPGLGINIFAFVFVGFIFCGFYYLLRSTKLYLSFKRNQRLWLFLGMLLAILGPINFILAIYGINIFPASLFLIIPYLALVSYIILKYHVVEVGIFVNKIVLAGYFGLFVLIAYSFLVYIFHRIIGIEYYPSTIIAGSMVLLNLLFLVHYAGMMRLSKIADRVVYEKKASYYKFLENFSLILDKKLDLPKLVNYILDSLVSILGMESATIYLFEESQLFFELIAHKGVGKEQLKDMQKISLENSFIKFLREGNVYVNGETEDFSEDYDLQKIKEVFSKVKTRFSIPLNYSLPLYHQSDIVGFINLGDKKDGTPYSKEDMDIINAFGRQLSISVDNARLYSRAIEDDLTKLYRINYFNKRLQEEIERGARYNRGFALALIDVDDFKKINDTHGHLAGDDALRRIANVIKSSIRKADIAARYGGEEFSILMPETNKSNAAIAVERLRKSVEEEFKKPQDRFTATISVGIADYRPNIQKYDLIKEADDALYRAKREGKNRVVLGQ